MRRCLSSECMRVRICIFIARFYYANLYWLALICILDSLISAVQISDSWWINHRDRFYLGFLRFIWDSLFIYLSTLFHLISSFICFHIVSSGGISFMYRHQKQLVHFRWICDSFPSLFNSIDYQFPRLGEPRPPSSVHRRWSLFTHPLFGVEKL